MFFLSVFCERRQAITACCHAPNVCVCFTCIARIVNTNIMSSSRRLYIFRKCAHGCAPTHNLRDIFNHKLIGKV